MHRLNVRRSVQINLRHLSQHFPFEQVCKGTHYHWLFIVLYAHGEDIDADDKSDEEVQVVAGTQRVDGQTQGRVVVIVAPELGLWITKIQEQTNI